MSKKTCGCISKKGLLIFLFLMMILSGCKSKEELELERANREYENSLKAYQDSVDRYNDLLDSIERIQNLQNQLNGYGD